MMLLEEESDQFKTMKRELTVRHGVGQLWMGYLEGQRFVLGLELKTELFRVSFQFGSLVQFNLILSHLHLQHQI